MLHYKCLYNQITWAIALQQMTRGVQVVKISVDKCCYVNWTKTSHRLLLHVVVYSTASVSNFLSLDKMWRLILRQALSTVCTKSILRAYSVQCKDRLFFRETYFIQCSVLTFQGNFYQSSVDVDSQTESNHDTALTLACAGGHAELVTLLLAKGANIEHRDKKGMLA